MKKIVTSAVHCTSTEPGCFISSPEVSPREWDVSVQKQEGEALGLTYVTEKTSLRVTRAGRTTPAGAGWGGGVQGISRL